MKEWDCTVYYQLGFIQSGEQPPTPAPTLARKGRNIGSCRISDSLTLLIPDYRPRPKPNPTPRSRISYMTRFLYSYRNYTHLLIPSVHLQLEPSGHSSPSSTQHHEYHSKWTHYCHLHRVLVFLAFDRDRSWSSPRCLFHGREFSSS